jgi:ribose-phosphate pyrophosphokinase
MNEVIIFALAGNEKLATRLASLTKYELGKLEHRRFPDNETYLRILSNVKNKNVVLVCTLNDPDSKFLSVLFLSRTLKEMGASGITMVAPYLAYMRQDKIFNPGESLTSKIFAEIFSGFVDRIITVDPHLHRRKSMEEIYSIPCSVLFSAPLIAGYIKKNITRPFLVGPDCESEQWVSEVATNASAPFVILEKIRKGDREVEISVPSAGKYRDHTPVLVDDIVSTGRTMIETVKHLKNGDFQKPFCIATHAVFSGPAYNDLIEAGASKIITCNTIPHESNEIDVSVLIAQSLKIET